MSEQIVSGSICKVNLESDKNESFLFVFVKKSKTNDYYVIDYNSKPFVIKEKLKDSLITCVGNLPFKCAGVSGSHNVFFVDNSLIIPIQQEKFYKNCTIIS